MTREWFAPLEQRVNQADADVGSSSPKKPMPLALDEFDWLLINATPS